METKQFKVTVDGAVIYQREIVGIIDNPETFAMKVARHVPLEGVLTIPKGMALDTFSMLLLLPPDPYEEEEEPPSTADLDMRDKGVVS